MDLNRASTFVRVVESGSFTRAAQALALPTSSISRSVSKLEHDLGVTLLERTTRRIALTDAGRAFFERARDALAGLEQASTLALDAASEIHGIVRVACPADIGAMIAGLFARLLEDHPKIRLELTFTTRGDELVGDLVDLAVVIGRLPDSSLVTRRLGEATHRLYAAPSYIEHRGMPRTFADLAKHDAVATRSIAGDTRWDLVGPRGTRERIDVPARITGDHLGFVTDAAVSGLGIALLPIWIADPRVAVGSLVAVLPRYSTQMALHLLAHASRHMPRRVAIVRDYIAEAMSGECTKHGA